MGIAAVVHDSNLFERRELASEGGVQPSQPMSFEMATDELISRGLQGSITLRIEDQTDGELRGKWRSFEGSVSLSSANLQVVNSLLGKGDQARLWRRVSEAQTRLLVERNERESTLRLEQLQLENEIGRMRGQFGIRQLESQSSGDLSNIAPSSRLPTSSGDLSNIAPSSRLPTSSGDLTEIETPASTSRTTTSWLYNSEDSHSQDLTHFGHMLDREIHVEK